MPFRFRALVSSLAACLALAAPGVAQGAPLPWLVDLSESGETFAFQVQASADPASAPTVVVRLAEAAAWDRLDFEVRGAMVGSTLRFSVPGAPSTLRPQTSIGVVDGVFVWNAVEAQTSAATGELRFEVTVPRERFLVRLTGPPGGPTEAPFYSWERYLQYMNSLLGEPDAQITSIGTSVQGRPILRVVVDVPSSTPKKTVMMGVRQHGDEFGSSYVLEGALDLLLGRNGLTPEPELLEKIRWIIYPCMNPDGSFNNVRYNSRGVDLNRDWDRNGANASTQEPETFALQTDVEAFQALYGIDIAGDHHGWGSTPDGGFRYAQGQSVSFVSGPEYQEARKDTEMFTLYDPLHTNWVENGGTTGMLRSEMYHRFGFLLHTPEYNSFVTTETQFRTRGQAWLRAMLDTLYAPTFTDGDGVPRPFVVLPADIIHVTVDDLDENQAAGEAEFVSVTVSDAVTGDVETLGLVETGLNTGVFRNATPLVVARGAAVPGNGILESANGSELTATYTDDDYARDTSTASIPVLPDRRIRNAPQPQPR